jgi:hypothetical protein
VDHLCQQPGAVVAHAELPGGQHAFDLFSSIRFEAVVDGIEAFTRQVGGAAATTSAPRRRRPPTAHRFARRRDRAWPDRRRAAEAPGGAGGHRQFITSVALGAEARRGSGGMTAPAGPALEWVRAVDHSPELRGWPAVPALGLRCRLGSA